MFPASLLILWTLVTLLAGTSALAVGGASRAKLSAALKRLGRPDAMDVFEQHRNDYAMIALIYRQLGIVLFVVTLCVLVPPTGSPIRQPAIVFGVSAVWFLIFAAAIPTAWARYAGEAHIANVLRMLELLRRLSAPVLWFVRGIDEIVRRLAAVPREEAEQSVRLERELIDVVTHADAEGPVDATERAMIKSVMAMDEKSAGQVMTPRTDMIGVEVNSMFDEVRELALTSAHSRLPVFEETLDHVVGVLYTKDLLTVSNPAEFSLRNMMKPIPFVPETKDVASLLREFQSSRIHMAIVLDEYGGTAGLVTIEDILEELVGEIADEHDDPVTAGIQKVNDSLVEVDARVRVESLNASLGTHIPEHESYDTIAGFVFSRLGKIPHAGETVATDGVRIEVLSATDRSITRLRVHVTPGHTEHAQWREAPTSP